MAKTLIEVRKQIEDLKAMEEELRRAEAQGVISRIREAIAVYGLTRADLFGASTGKGTSKSKAASASGQVRFSDDAGNTWSGRGRRPAWLVTALASGKSMEDFSGSGSLTGSVKESGGEKSAAKKTSKASKSKVVAVKYQDGENRWSGRGSQPRWLKDALASGKQLSDFAV